MSLKSFTAFDKIPWIAIDNYSSIIANYYIRFNSTYKLSLHTLHNFITNIIAQNYKLKAPRRTQKTFKAQITDIRGREFLPILTIISLLIYSTLL
jgi:hypothetical protein